MANVLPKFTFEQIVEMHSSEGEALVYDALERTLDPDCTAIFSAAWISRNRDGGARDGETDFLVVSPKFGLLVLEVKGGRIERDAGSGRWKSWDRNGTEHIISDPFEQARRSKYSLIEKVKSLPGWGNSYVPAAHGVVFPNSESQTTFLGFDAPAEIVAFSGDLPALGNWTASVFEFWAKTEKSERGLSPDQVDSLIGAFSPEVRIGPSLGGAIATDSAQIIKATVSQSRLLNQLRLQRRAEISGGAGTGKTMLATAKARRLASEGFRTLFTCFNRSLGLEIEKASVGVENLTAIHFHELCMRMAEEYSGDEPGAIRSQVGPEFWNTGLAEMLGQCVADNPDLKWDAIVVDEGQDFRAEWWVTLMECLRDPEEGFLWVFHDDNQLIFQDEPEIPGGLTPISLEENLRNTKTIHGLTERFYSGPEFIAAGPAGRDIDFRFARHHSIQRRMVSRIIHDLIQNEGVAPHDIAVLTGVSIDKSRLMVEGRIGAFECVNAEMREKGKVVVDSVWRFKGLESAVVILAETRSDCRDGVLYVAASRARSHLIVIGDNELRDRMGLSGTPSGGDGNQS